MPKYTTCIRVSTAHYSVMHSLIQIYTISIQNFFQKENGKKISSKLPFWNVLPSSKENVSVGSIIYIMHYKFLKQICSKAIKAHMQWYRSVIRYFTLTDFLKEFRELSMLAECICIRQAHMQKDLTTMRNFPTHRNNNVSLHLVCINISQRDPDMFKLISSFSRQNKTPNSNLNIKEIKYTVENKVTEPDKMFIKVHGWKPQNHAKSFKQPHEFILAPPPPKKIYKSLIPDKHFLHWW